MTKEEKIQIGEEILRGYEALSRDWESRHKLDDYICSILHAVSLDTYDIPIPREDMCIALAEAQATGKKVKVVPDRAKNKGKLDGWCYKLKLV